MKLKSKPGAIQVKPGWLTPECIGCEVVWKRDGNPFNTRDAYLVDWDDEKEVTIKLKGKSKTFKVPYEHVIFHYIQLEKGWIFDGGSPLAVDPIMRDPIYLETVYEPDEQQQKEAQGIDVQESVDSDEEKEDNAVEKEKQQTSMQSPSPQKKSTPKKKKESDNKKRTSTKKKQPKDLEFMKAKKPKLKNSMV